MLKPPSPHFPVWETKRGEKIPVYRMRAEHVLNTVRLLITKEDESEARINHVSVLGLPLVDVDDLEEFLVDSAKASSVRKQWIEVLKEELRGRMARRDLGYSHLAKETSRYNERRREELRRRRFLR